MRCLTNVNRMSRFTENAVHFFLLCLFCSLQQKSYKSTCSFLSTICHPHATFTSSYAYSVHRNKRVTKVRAAFCQPFVNHMQHQCSPLTSKKSKNGSKRVKLNNNKIQAPTSHGDTKTNVTTEPAITHIQLNNKEIQAPTNYSDARTNEGQ